MPFTYWIMIIFCSLGHNVLTIWVGWFHFLFACTNSPIPFVLSYSLHRCSAWMQGLWPFQDCRMCPTCRRSQIASLGAYRAKRFTLIYCFYGSSECRGYYPEQLHQFHFGHPNITAWDIHSAILADCYNCSFHSYIAIEISLNDWLSLLPNIVKSLSIFSVVILAYFCVVVMFVCPKTRLTLSMGTPLLRASVANPWRLEWKEISFVIPHSFIIFFHGLQMFQ